MNLPAASRRVSNFNKEIYLFSPCGKPQGIIKFKFRCGVSYQSRNLFRLVSYRLQLVNISGGGQCVSCCVCVCESASGRAFYL